MKLIGATSSPYVRKVRIVMAEKKLDYEFVREDVWAADTTIAQSNPLGKVPCLVMEGGEALFDSRVIVEYLDHVSPVAHLIPSEPKVRMMVRGVEALADGVTDAAVAVNLERKRAPEQRSSDWMTLQEKTLFRGLEALSEALGEKPWFLGNSNSMLTASFSRNSKLPRVE